MTEIERLVSEIETYARRSGISPSTVGERAGQGGLFYRRLKEGRRAWPDTIEKVRRYMSDNPPPVPEATKSEAA